MLSKNYGKAAAGVILAGILATGLLAGCGNGNPSGNANVMDSLVVYGGIASNIGCLETNIGHQGELLIFCTRVVDPQTGEDMTDQNIQSVEVVLPDGQVFDETYGGDPGGAPRPIISGRLPGKFR